MRGIKAKSRTPSEVVPCAWKPLKFPTFLEFCPARRAGGQASVRWRAGNPYREEGCRSGWAS
ncbi:Hypothetical protein AA314_04884 [Archangium gephyra]|uniref:Uncharacterized protein n=1 Tax=Archangium gephyra TaxID=48 RepID=A0AAC8Q923_9BACT|nr:Hypothetical protein AA314_04884 [Archangium gephyra]